MHIIAFAAIALLQAVLAAHIPMSSEGPVVLPERLSDRFQTMALEERNSIADPAVKRISRLPQEMWDMIYYQLLRGRDYKAIQAWTMSSKASHGSFAEYAQTTEGADMLVPLITAPLLQDLTRPEDSIKLPDWQIESLARVTTWAVPVDIVDFRSAHTVPRAEAVARRIGFLLRYMGKLQILDLGLHLVHGVPQRNAIRSVLHDLYGAYPSNLVSLTVSSLSMSIVEQLLLLDGEPTLPQLKMLTIKGVTAASPTEWASLSKLIVMSSDLSDVNVWHARYFYLYSDPDDPDSSRFQRPNMQLFERGVLHVDTTGPRVVSTPSRRILYGMDLQDN